MNIPIAGLRGHFHKLIEKGMINDICDRDEVDRRVRAFIEGFLLRDSSVGHRYVSEKTPDNVFVFSPLLELFPEAKFILVLRDPRAVIHSLHKVAIEARKRSLWVARTSRPSGFDRLCEARSCRGLERDRQSAGPDLHVEVRRSGFGAGPDDAGPLRISRARVVRAHADSGRVRAPGRETVHPQSAEVRPEALPKKHRRRESRDLEA